MDSASDASTLKGVGGGLEGVGEVLVSIIRGRLEADLEGRHHDLHGGKAAISALSWSLEAAITALCVSPTILDTIPALQLTSESA